MFIVSFLIEVRRQIPYQIVDTICSDRTIFDTPLIIIQYNITLEDIKLIFCTKYSVTVQALIL